MVAVLEFHVQRALCLWLNGYPNPQGFATVPLPLIPGVVWWSTPNGGRRDAREAKALKETGVQAGIPDLFFLWGRLYGLELKKAKGRTSAAQDELHPRLIHAGALIAVVDNLAAAKAQIVAWGLTAR